MCSHYLYDPDSCNAASGWEKGRVEKNVQDSRRRIWIDAAKHRFGFFAEINASLGERCCSRWSEVRHPEHSQFGVAEMLERAVTVKMPWAPVRETPCRPRSDASSRLRGGLLPGRQKIGHAGIVNG